MSEENTLFDLKPYEMSEKTAPSGKGIPRLKIACRDQYEMKLISLDNLISKDHPVRRIWSYVEKLDLSMKLDSIKSLEGTAGRPAIDPKILLALWLYATIEGISSAHLLSRYTKEHSAFQWLCGGVQIERRTISQFRIDNGELFDDLLAQCIAILVKAGAVTIEEIAQDGLRVRASAGRGSFKKEMKIKELYTAAKERVTYLKKEMDADPQLCNNRLKKNELKKEQEKIEKLKAAENELHSYLEKKNDMRRKHKKKLVTKAEPVKVSITDPEARIMKMADGGFRPAYNFQFGVDTKNNFIVAVDVTNAGTDGGQMLSMYETIKNNFRKTPTRYLADGGFKNQTDIEKMTQEGCQVYVPLQKQKNPHAYKQEDSKEIREWKERMNQEESKTIYKRRASTVELVNANARFCGLDQLKVRGLEKAKNIAKMFGLAYNMMRTFAVKFA